MWWYGYACGLLTITLGHGAIVDCEVALLLPLAERTLGVVACLGSVEEERAVNWTNKKKMKRTQRTQPLDTLIYVFLLALLSTSHAHRPVQDQDSIT
uniref:Putative secreted protein n=1 Tax=Anopheles darlingi TaxID=43151 RepID=A0A2M4D0M3_ANODA